MGIYGEGTVEIPLEEFWNLVMEYIADKNSEMFFGVPHLSNENQTINVDYMFNSDCDPQDEVDFEKSKCKLQWDELRKKTQ